SRQVRQHRSPRSIATEPGASAASCHRRHPDLILGHLRGVGNKDPGGRRHAPALAPDDSSRGYGRTPVKLAAEKSPSKASAWVIRSRCMVAKLVASTNE